MIYVILGTTASGKTDLALKLAKKYQLPLIGADAFQVYQEMKIGTAKPDDEELEGLSHHMIGDHSAANPLSIALYQQEVREILKRYEEEGHDVIMVGGSFLYVKAALFDYQFPLEENDPSEDYENLSPEELMAELKSLDPAIAKTLHINNKRRIIRAIINLKNGKNLTLKNQNRLLYPATFLAIDMDSKTNADRIQSRTKKMFDLGLIEEVKALCNIENVSPNALQAIGYKEVIEGLKENKSLEEMTEEIALRTRQYAKRQRTFLRHQFTDLHLLSATEIFDLVSFSIDQKIRTRKALGDKNYLILEKKRVLLVGLGGVGAIIASMLARLGVFSITLMDFDEVEASNLNRQIIYTREDIGRNKTDVAKDYLQKINPLVSIKTLPLRLDSSTIEEIKKEEYDFVFDAIDDVSAKLLLTKYCLSKGIPFIIATGTGRKIDSTLVEIGTLVKTGDPLAKALKKRLKEEGIDPSMVNCIYSSEKPAVNDPTVMKSLPTVPNAAGLAMLSFFINYFTK